MAVPYKIVCAPVAIRYKCPYCGADIESKWSLLNVLNGVTICPKCSVNVNLGEGELQ